VINVAALHPNTVLMLNVDNTRTRRSIKCLNYHTRSTQLQQHIKMHNTQTHIKTDEQKTNTRNTANNASLSNIKLNNQRHNTLHAIVVTQINAIGVLTVDNKTHEDTLVTSRAAVSSRSGAQLIALRSTA
jgi:hypothetical protein